ncbi:hypothetical protein ACFQ07_27695, partial [Actinomadura adrarensis]
RPAIGDARTIATAHAPLRGEAALVLTLRRTGSRTHGHVRSCKRDGDGGPVTKWNHRYSADRGNPAHRAMLELLDAFGQILAATGQLLWPGGVVAVTVRPIRDRGELIDLPGQVIDIANRYGLVLVGRRVALPAGLRDGGWSLGPRSSRCSKPDGPATRASPPARSPTKPARSVPSSA